MKTVLFLDGSRFKHKIVENFIDERFPAKELDLVKSYYLPSILCRKEIIKFDGIIIGDNIDIADISAAKPSYRAPHLTRDFIISMLGYTPKFCLFTNVIDYTRFALPESEFCEICNVQNLPYINNLENDAFDKLYEFIKSI